MESKIKKTTNQMAPLLDYFHLLICISIDGSV